MAKQHKQMSTKACAEKPSFVGFGEVLWDHLPGGRALGGAPVNVAGHAAQLGVGAAVVTAVGDDAEGSEILARLRELHVDVSGVRLARGLPTGAVDVRLDEAGVPTFDIRAPAAWDGIEIDEEIEALARSAAAVVFGSLAQRDPRSRGSLRRFLHCVPSECLKVFDINLRPPHYSREIVINSLEQANVLKLNDGELPLLAAMLGLSGDTTTMLQEVRARFALDLVIFTCGAQGSRLITSEWDVSHPGCTVKVADTVGAGDAFTAVVMVGLLRSLPLGRIQELANRAAAFVCSQPGAVPRLPEEIVGEFRIGVRP